MKSFCTLLMAFLPFAVQLNAQCDAPDAVKNYYRADARQLALRNMETNIQLADSIAIPDYLVKPYLDALLAVYNAVQYPERDSVVECHAIKAFPNPNGFQLTLVLLSSENWVQNLKNGIIPTGNSQVDQLMSYYSLQVSSFFELGNKIYFTLDSPVMLHTRALAKRFEGIPGVYISDVASIAGAGNDIIYGQQGNSHILSYKLGWGDCQAGCIYNRWWSFQVNPDCSVDYLGVTGNDIDFPIQCSNYFQCATEPLCMPWMRDSITAALGLLSDCDAVPQYPGLQLLQYESFGQIVWGLKTVLGTDAEHTRFYTCDGQYLGKCDVTIAGLNCDGPDFINYLNSPVVWDCTQSLPTPAACGLTDVPEPPDAVNIRITPNPARSTVTMLLPENSVRNWEVFNVAGLSMGVVRSADQSVDIDVSAWPAGVYVVRGRTADGAALAGKFVVLR